MDNSQRRALNDFMNTHGRSLEEYGSLERAYTKEEAILFIQLIRKLDGSILGLDFWRKEGQRYRLDSLASWAADESDSQGSYAEAINTIETMRLSDEDLFTLQFD